MTGIVLSVEVRERTGTGGARETRRGGEVPGILYGGPRGPIAISVKEKELKKVLTSGKFLSHMVEIDHKGERQPVIPREVQFHPVTDNPIHIDLYRVEEDSIIDVAVPVEFVGHEACPGLKRGTLNVVRHTVELRVPAGKIPEKITADLSGLAVGAVIHISAIKMPSGAKPKISNRDFTVATIASRGGAAEAEEATEEAAG
jgi:large subunit ribosomal protein L25